MTSDGQSLYDEHMNAHTDTPLYYDAFDEAVTVAVNSNDMELLTTLENMNSDTAIQPTNRKTDIPF